MDKKFTTYDPTAAGSKGLIYFGDKILVYRRDSRTTLHPHELDLPGGGAEGKESPFETFVREVREEFGVQITADVIIASTTYPSTLQPDRVAYFFVAKLPATAAMQIVFGTEGSEYMLMEPAEFISRTDGWPIMQDRTKDYLDSLAKP